jgi:uncharacterized protein (DUF305 family)
MRNAAFCSLVLVTAMSIAPPSSAQTVEPGTIPLGLADGPYVHVMAVHHEEGIKIAMLGDARAANDKVKALAGRVRANRQKELAELKQFMSSVAEDMAPTNKSDLKKIALERLHKAAGAAFDRMLLDVLIEHHQDALTMTRTAKLVMSGVQHFAARLTQTLTAELGEAQALRKELRDQTKADSHRHE